MNWLVVLFLLGVNSTLWSVVALMRFATERINFRKPVKASVTDVKQLMLKDVAVLIPAHNEEVCIRDTLSSVLRMLPASNVHVVADGCTDRTVQIATEHGVNVLELSPSRGKAGGIAAAVQTFRFSERFGVLLITDADTVLSENYLEHGLAMLDDPEMGALAGYAYSSWQPRNLSLVGRFLIAYRTRLYAVMQFVKYGQTSRYTNVTTIVPGFASMYRTSLLPKMDLNPPGLVIEDFNMTFELRHKRLGKVAFSSKAFATAQDPDNLRDYYRQVTRWSLGFWQTLRRHGFWLSGFSAALALFLLEVIIASTVMVAVALGVLIAAIAPLMADPTAVPVWWAWSLATATSMASPLNLFLFVFVPDYLLTIAVAVWMRRPSLLVYGTAFLFVRLIDSTAMFWSLVKMLRTKSTGRWSSPSRRVVESATSSPTPMGVAHESTAGVPAELLGGPQVGEVGPSREARAARLDAGTVSRDALLVSSIVCLTAGLVVAASLPISAVIASVVALMVLVLVFTRGVGLARATRRVLTWVAAELISAACFLGTGRGAARRAGEQ